MIYIMYILRNDNFVKAINESILSRTMMCVYYVCMFVFLKIEK